MIFSFAATRDCRDCFAIMPPRRHAERSDARASRATPFADAPTQPPRAARIYAPRRGAIFADADTAARRR